MAQYMLGVHHKGPDDEAFNWPDRREAEPFEVEVTAEGRGCGGSADTGGDDARAFRRDGGL